MSTDRLIVFARYPSPGQVKTRLIPALGAEGAARLHEEMVFRTLACAQRAAHANDARVTACFTGAGARAMRRWLGDGLEYRVQRGTTLGERMDRALTETLAAADLAVLIGTDCPGLTPALLGDALAALRGRDLVLGPASDGGYYLVGLRRPCPALFDGIAWGTDAVRSQTLAAAARLGLTVHQLPRLDDIDRPEDLPAWDRLRPAGEDDLSITVIIPALNEADGIAATIATARAASGAEIVVADGGSTDGTPGVAEAHGARVVRTPPDFAALRRGKPGRALQMNAAAAVASGDILVFLHADTRLPQGYDEHVRETLRRPGVVAGAFTLRLDAPRRSLRVIERLADFRARRLALPYGDQAIFLRAETFWAAGGFPDQPIMEDLDLVRHLRRRGAIALVPAPAVTSARRWLRLGVIRTTLINQLMLAGRALGIPLARLAAFYRAAGSND